MVAAMGPSIGDGWVIQFYNKQQVAIGLSWTGKTTTKQTNKIQQQRKKHLVKLSLTYKKILHSIAWNRKFKVMVV